MQSSINEQPQSNNTNQIDNHTNEIIMYKQIKSLKHFTHEMPLPQSVRIFSYSKKCQSKKKKKLKDKFQTFKYYQHNQTKQIHKILFITDDLYIDQGLYPFTQPTGQLRNFTELDNTKRLTITEAAYIGHLNNLQQLVIKKMQGVKLSNEGTEFQTDNDDFELIKLGNEQRFNQFVKLMSYNENSISMSIRVVIDQSYQQPRVIDYQFFFREKELKKKYQQNNKYQIKQ